LVLHFNLLKVDMIFRVIINSKFNSDLSQIQ
jgi:hypothetical protein